MPGNTLPPLQEHSAFTSGRPNHLRRPLRILLCPDKPGWAFDNIANNIIRFAPDHFHISKYFMGDPEKRDISEIFELMAIENIDVVHFFWREDLFELLRPASILAASKKLKMPFTKVVEILSARALTTSVYDHLYAGEAQILSRTHAFNLIDSYSVSSDILAQIYSSIAEIPAPDVQITDGVDLELFKPLPSGFNPDLACPKIGWAGNSAWGGLEGGDPKGFHRLFLPALEILKNNGMSFQQVVADSQTNPRAFAEMPDYYRSIDLFTCTSSQEGTPNPVLEAMATGIPIVSTDVGIVRQALGPKQAGFIVGEPTPETFAHSIANILRDETLFHEFHRENLEQIKPWSWKHRTEPWWPFWLSAFARANNTRMSYRRASLIVQSCIHHQRRTRFSDAGKRLKTKMGSLVRFKH